MIGRMLGRLLGEELSKNPRRAEALLPGLGGVFAGVDFFAKRLPWWVWVAASIWAASWWFGRRKAVVVGS